MRRVVYLVSGALLLAASAVLFFYAGTYPRGITNSVIRTSSAERTERAGRVNAIYKQSYAVSGGRTDMIASYIPVYEQTLFKDFGVYAAAFGEFGGYTEAGGEYVYKNGHSELRISGDTDCLFYVTSGTDPCRDGAVSPLGAVEAAEGFITERALPLKYGETKVSVGESGYTVLFLPKLDGLRNYAHPITVSLDFYGNVRSLEYYLFEYERLGAAKAYTMKEAFLLLPVVDAGGASLDGESIDLKSCELVYFYENSIVQPGYLFLGEFAGGGGDFECFVKASKY